MMRRHCGAFHDIPPVPPRRSQHRTRSHRLVLDGGPGELGWSVYHLNQIKTLKRQISDAQLSYLKAVAEAVIAIPVPEPEPTMSPENLRVMLLDDIAAKLADEYPSRQRRAGTCPEKRWPVRSGPSGNWLTG